MMDDLVFPLSESGANVVLTKEIFQGNDSKAIEITTHGFLSHKR